MKLPEVMRLIAAYKWAREHGTRKQQLDTRQALFRALEHD
jgi:hypothetical protein